MLIALTLILFISTFCRRLLYEVQNSADYNSSRPLKIDVVRVCVCVSVCLCVCPPYGFCKSPWVLSAEILAMGFLGV